MNKAAEILLQRMETRPDEFYSNHTKWTFAKNAIINRYMEVHELVTKAYPPVPVQPYQICPFTDEEVEALYAKLQQIVGEEFLSHVLNNLLKEPEPDYVNQGYVGTGTTTGRTIPYSVPPNTPLTSSLGSQLKQALTGNLNQAYTNNKP